jgi:hypothetical protein
MSITRNAVQTISRMVGYETVPVVDFQPILQVRRHHVVTTPNNEDQHQVCIISAFKNRMFVCLFVFLFVFLRMLYR